jgi:hypothetical protein
VTAAEALPAELPALSVWQPGASLIVAGLKRYDLHTWAAPPEFHYRRIAIHAASRPVGRPEIRKLLYYMPRDGGKGILHAEMTAEQLDDAIELVRQARWLPRGAFIGIVTLGKPVRTSEVPGTPYGGLSKADAGHWAWPMFPAQWMPQIKAKGTGGFFTMQVPDAWRREPADVI